MKKLSQILTLALFAGAALFIQSCDNTEEIGAAPSVSLDETSGQDIPESSVTITATVSAPNGGKSLVVYVNGSEEETIDLAGAKEATEEFTHEIPASAVIGSKIIISFQVIDNKDYPSAIENFVLTVGDPVITLTGTLTTQTLDATKPYLLKDKVFIPTGVTLTVPAGTVIKGDKATKAVLLVEPGGKLIAEGTSTNPIVFTSNQAPGERDRGDWGGVIILGNAWVNQTALPAIEGITPSKTYGNITSPTTNADHNGGSLKFVRIEYAGIELTPNNETNSLTMGGVGNLTTIENVQVSFGGDDGFEWFGGGVNAKYLISLSTWDDDFDTDFGWSGKVQFGLAVRNPFFADQSGSTAFESDNQGNANDTPSGSAGYTRGVFSNITVLGPRDVNTGTGSTSTAARAISANYTNAIHIRRRTAVSIFNSFISGFPVGLRLDDVATYDNLVAGTGAHTHNVLLSPNTTELGTTTSSTNVGFATGITPGGSTAGDATPVRDYWTSNNNTFDKPSGAAGWSPVAATPAGSIEPYAAYGISRSLFWAGQTSSNYPSNPDFKLTGTTPTLASGANFDNAKLDAFFTDTAYRGAFGGTTDWTDGWAEFQPLNKVY